jgi:hypothetical protein
MVPKLGAGNFISFLHPTVQKEAAALQKKVTGSSQAEVLGAVPSQ